jgi:hypothetical protein
VVPTFAERGQRWGPRHSFADTVGDFGDFENRIDFGFNAAEFAGTFEGGDPLAKVSVRQSGLPGK